MLYRAAFYLLIVSIGIIGTIGLGVWNPGGKRSATSATVVVAAPLAGADNADNGETDNSETDNSDTDNASADNSDNSASSSADNGDNVVCEADNSDNSASSSADNGDNTVSDNSASDNSSEDNSDNSSSWIPFGGFASILAKGSSCDDDNGDNEGVIVSSPPPPASRPAPAPRPVTATPPQPISQPQPPAPLPEPCIFTLGFANLRAEMIRFEGQDVMGVCRENEHGNVNAATGQLIDLNTLQLTANGLNVWDQPTNTMRFTNGAFTWTYSKCLLQKRANTEVFAWERNPSLLQYPGEAPPPPGACGLV
jgi:hypothetical protein